jgi:hypothetical protein
MMAAALSAALMLPASALSSDHRGAGRPRTCRRPTEYHGLADQEMVGSTLYRAAIALAVAESGPGGATKIASR